MTRKEPKPSFDLESETVEWKRSLGEWKEIVITAAAMGSLRGGHIYIGVEPSGEVCGIRVGKGSLEDLANKITQNTSPRVTPSISSTNRDGRTILVVSVPESRPKPVYAFDRPYLRSGRTNQRLSPEEALHLYMTSRGITWDQSTLPDATIDEDIDPAIIRRFLLAARTERRWEVSERTSAGQVLRQLGLIQDGKLTVAAVLLFDRNPQRLLTQAMGKKESDRQNLALNYIRQHGRITRVKYEEISGLPVHTAKRVLDRMIKAGSIFRHGQGRSYWSTLRDNGSVPQNVPQSPRKK